MVSSSSKNPDRLAGRPGCCMATATDDTWMVAEVPSLFIQMAINANTLVSYELSNHRNALAGVIERACAEMNKSKGGAAKLKASIQQHVRENNFAGKFQVSKPADQGGRFFTIRELCDSYKHESTQQVIDPKAVENILFGSDGLIRRAGGGRTPYLMEDIEVGFVTDRVAGTAVGPVITSGRNRTLALQILLEAAGLATNAVLDMVKIRVSVIEVFSREELQRRIISANTGSRDFSRAEIRERMGSTKGVVMLDRRTIETSIAMATKESEMRAALGAWIKDAAGAMSLNNLTPTQYSDAGSSVFSRLAKSRPEGKTFYRWVKDDSTRFLAIAKACETFLPNAVEAATQDTSAGPLAAKLARILTPMVGSQVGLNFKF